MRGADDGAASASRNDSFPFHDDDNHHGPKTFDSYDLVMTRHTKTIWSPRVTPV